MKLQGFKGFTILTLGQLISMVGSSMTQFGLGIWIWEKTGNATPFSIIAVCFMVPNLLFSPIAGTLIDRWPKKRGLILPDLSAGLITVLLIVLFTSYTCFGLDRELVLDLALSLVRFDPN